MSAVPETITYTDADMNAQNVPREKVPVDHWARYVIARTKKTVSEKKGTLGLRLTLNPLTEDGEVDTGIQEFHTLWMPFANPNKPGHTAPRTRKMMYNFLKSIEPDFRPYPTKDADGNWVMDGQILEEDQRKEVFDTAHRQVMDKVQNLWNNADEVLQNELIWAKKQMGEGNEIYKAREELNFFQADPPRGDEEKIFYAKSGAVSF